MGSSSVHGSSYDYSFKILLIGDSGVGKSSLLVSFISNHVDDLTPTIGVDFKIKHLTVSGKKLKLTIWDTAGQEKFRTLTSSYFRNAQGIILVYDVTQRESFTNLSEVWAKEIELYSTNQDDIKMLVGNKVDKEGERVVTKEEGIAFAQEYGCVFLECSAKTRANVEKCFEELAHKTVDVRNQLSLYKSLNFSMKCHFFDNHLWGLPRKCAIRDGISNIFHDTISYQLHLILSLTSSRLCLKFHNVKQL